jgi:hypothetical protein
MRQLAIGKETAPPTEISRVLYTFSTDYRIEWIVLGPVCVKAQHDRRFTFPPFTPGLRIRAHKIKYRTAKAGHRPSAEVCRIDPGCAGSTRYYIFFVIIRSLLVSEGGTLESRILILSPLKVGSDRFTPWCVLRNQLSAMIKILAEERPQPSTQLRGVSKSAQSDHPASSGHLRSAMSR